MKTLTAKDTARAALRKRKVTELAALVRGRVECFPGSRQWDKLEAAERKIGLLQYDAAEAMLLEIDQALVRHEADLAKAKAEAEAKDHDAMLAANGIDTARSASGVGQRHGLLWLIHKGRITGDRRTAGLRWSDDYSLVRTDGLRSCLNDNAPGSPTDAQAERQQEKLSSAAARLARARFHIAASTGSTRLADLLDAVCGRGETLRALAKDDKVKAAMLEVELSIALDMAGVSYDIVKVAA